MKGRDIPARPDETAGESTAWYASFWDFCATYLSSRFGKKLSLSPEQSLLLHTGNRRVSASVLQNILQFMKILAGLIKEKI